jgi:hypothetical protein
VAGLRFIVRPKGERFIFCQWYLVGNPPCLWWVNVSVQYKKKSEDNGIQRDGSYPSHSFVKRLERKQMGP